MTSKRFEPLRYRPSFVSGCSGNSRGRRRNRGPVFHRIVLEECESEKYGRVRVGVVVEAERRVPGVVVAGTRKHPEQRHENRERYLVGKTRPSHS